MFWLTGKISLVKNLFLESGLYRHTIGWTTASAIKLSISTFDVTALKGRHMRKNLGMAKISIMHSWQHKRQM